MSTRCQVKISQEGLNDWKDTITLYHHCDGYPSNIVPLLQRAYINSGGGWESGRAGKAASYIIATDPGQFEPESEHKLHVDIEYLYRLYVINIPPAIGDEETVRWELEVLVPEEGFWDKPTIKNMSIILERTPLLSLTEELEALREGD